MNERFTARAYIDYVLSRQELTVEDLGLAPVVVVSWNPRTVRSLADAVGAENSQHWADIAGFPLYTGEVGGRRISFTGAPIGAPATVTLLEEMIACGARAFIGLGGAGSLQPTAPAGTFLIPTSCLSEEGTSRHYVETMTDIGPDPQLAGLISRSCQAERNKTLTGPLWTTDAPFRETVDKIETYRRQGILGVDMETSAMYALCKFRGVAVCNLLVVSDELWDEWKPTFGQPELREAVSRAERAILRCLPEVCSSVERGESPA
ncbi:MAG: nucleoside phosphorylase [Actinomycetota bacterium]|jgi:uridine phosphorylase|nr:nucleoside phosphorylase [Actinomycetota bacterium]MDP9486680.1 nucleoside phosphorylase [Actinomycetota bacterium]